MKLQLPNGEILEISDLELRAAQIHYHLVGGDPIQLVKMYKGSARKLTAEELESMKQAAMARRDKIVKLKQRIITGHEKIYERRTLLDTTPEGTKKKALELGLEQAYSRMTELCDELMMLGYNQCHYDPSPGSATLGFTPPCEREGGMEKPCLVCPRKKEEK